MKTMRGNNVRCLQNRFIRSVGKVENIILDLKRHTGRPTELLHADQIPSINSSNSRSYPGCRSEERGRLQIRNSDTLTHTRVEVSENIEKLSFANIYQRRSDHSHYLRILVVGQKLNALRSEKQTRRQGFLIAEGHVNRRRSPTDLILIDHIVENQGRSMNDLNSGCCFERFLRLPAQGFGRKHDQ